MRLSGPTVNPAIVAQLENAKPNVAARLLGVLATRRRAADAIPSMLAAARDADAGVRSAALDALAQLEQPEQLAALVSLLLEAPNDQQHQAAERAITLICERIANPANGPTRTAGGLCQVKRPGPPGTVADARPPGWTGRVEDC